MAIRNAKSPGAHAALARLDDRPAAMSSAERRVLGEALRLGADLAGEVANKVSAYGRWLLESVFENDAAAALDERTENPVWLELLRRAGGPTLPISRRLLSVALRLAAYDRRISDQSWRGLDTGRKEILLPLADDRRLREAAQHVTKFNLTQRKTREYVVALRGAATEAPKVRLTAPALASRVRKLRESLDAAAVRRRVRAMHAELDPSERNAVAKEIEKLRDVLHGVARDLRGGR